MAVRHINDAAMLHTSPVVSYEMCVINYFLCGCWVAVYTVR